LQLYVQAYLLLDTERSQLEHIPWSAYVAYGKYYGLTRDQVDTLIEIGMSVDNEVLVERQKKANNGNA